MAKETCDIAVYLATSEEVEKTCGVFFYAASVGERLWREAERLTGI